MIKRCKICNKEFKTYPSKIKVGKGIYCSKSCTNISKKGITPNWNGVGYYQHKPQQGFQNNHKPFNNFFHKGMVAFRRGNEFKKGGHLGQEHPNWKGGRRITNKGYILIYSPNHPFANKKYVQEHRLVVEKQIGRYLKPSEKVHHINKITSDNRIENLILFKNQTFHEWFHIKGFSKPEGIIFDGRSTN